MNNTKPKKKSGKRANSAVTIRDVKFLCHPKPQTKEREELYKRIADRTLKTPDTWEVYLSRGDDKKKAFTDLINEGKLGGMAHLAVNAIERANFLWHQVNPQRHTQPTRRNRTEKVFVHWDDGV